MVTMVLEIGLEKLVFDSEYVLGFRKFNLGEPVGTESETKRGLEDTDMILTPPGLSSCRLHNSRPASVISPPRSVTKILAFSHLHVQRCVPHVSWSGLRLRRRRYR